MTTTRRFTPNEGSVGAARSFATEAVAGLPTEVREAVALMVSELATNALVHGGGGFDVSVDRTEGALFVAVADRGSGRPTARTPGVTELHGRGLQIVDRLADEWGVAPTGGDRAGGKSVWFRLAVPATGRRPGAPAHPGRSRR